MDPIVQSRFNDSILSELRDRYAIPAGRIQPLPFYESIMYAFERDDGQYILRVSHSARRSPAMIHGEAEWINHLAAGGAGVARAIPSLAGSLVEAVDDGHGQQFLGTAFVRARGQPPFKVGWSPALFETYGETLGLMHRLTTSYRPSNPAWRRPEWDDAGFNFVDQFLPAEQETVRQHYYALRQHLASLPRSPEAYGLIHQDAHGANFLVDEAGRITLFDFDDCMYAWFANDIGIVLFYMVSHAPDPAGLARQFMPAFLRGYERQYHIEPWWLKEVPNFLKLREIDLYAVLHRDFDLENPHNSWVAGFVKGRRQRIEQGLPFIDDAELGADFWSSLGG